MNWYRQAQKVKAMFSDFTRRAGSETEYIPRNEFYRGKTGDCAIDVFSDRTPPAVRVSIMIEEPKPDPEARIIVVIPWSPIAYAGRFRAEVQPERTREYVFDGRPTVTYTSPLITVNPGSADRTLNMAGTQVSLTGRVPNVEELPARELRTKRKRWK